MGRQDTARSEPHYGPPYSTDQIEPPQGDRPPALREVNEAAPIRGPPRVLIGARALAAYIFGSEEEWRRVYPLKKELGLFRLRGQVCGRPATIDARFAAREAASVANTTP
jgi:hypothetical protein